ncbi:MAG: thiol-disulfide isomerase [Haloplasmataceae bacterium]|jgi:predicted bacteriocin transport accessory protein|nr:thiol-disulfide isomerase [Haloplasmataceae bacterium]
MQKFKLVLLITTLLLLVGCTNKKDEVEEEVKVDPFTILPTINHEQFQTKFNSNEDFFVYIGRFDCGDSDIFEADFIRNFVNYDEEDQSIFSVDYNLNEKLYFFDISEIIETTKTYDQRNQYQELYGFYYTPTLVHYKNGEIVHIAEWDPVYDFDFTDYMKWFYDTNLVTPRPEVYHEGVSDHIINN